jgi:thioredoxin reductase (NADPH)
MSHYLVREVTATSNVEVRTGTAVIDGGGEGRLQELVLREAPAGDAETVPADALFVLIGARPHTAWLPREITRDRHGFLLTGEDVADDLRWPLERRPFALETSMPRVFAAGDVRQGSAQRVASAVGDGSVVIQDVHNLFVDEALHSGSRPRQSSLGAESRSGSVR